jgi:hypothetical protein
VDRLTKNGSGPQTRWTAPAHRRMCGKRLPQGTKSSWPALAPFVYDREQDRGGPQSSPGA